MGKNKAVNKTFCCFAPPAVPASPLTVHDRYSSPAAGSAKRRLFGDDPPSSGATANGNVMPSPAKRLTFGTTSTLKIAPANSPGTVVLQGESRGGDLDESWSEVFFLIFYTDSGVTLSKDR